MWTALVIFSSLVTMTAAETMMEESHRKGVEIFKKYVLNPTEGSSSARNSEGVFGQAETENFVVRSGNAEVRSVVVKIHENSELSFLYEENKKNELKGSGILQFSISGENRELVPVDYNRQSNIFFGTKFLIFNGNNKYDLPFYIPPTSNLNDDKKVVVTVEGKEYTFHYST